MKSYLEKSEEIKNEIEKLEAVKAKHAKSGNQHKFFDAFEKQQILKADLKRLQN